MTYSNAKLCGWGRPEERLARGNFHKSDICFFRGCGASNQKMRLTR